MLCSGCGLLCLLGLILTISVLFFLSPKPILIHIPGVYPILASAASCVCLLEGKGGWQGFLQVFKTLTTPSKTRPQTSSAQRLRLLLKMGQDGNPNAESCSLCTHGQLLITGNVLLPRIFTLELSIQNTWWLFSM